MHDAKNILSRFTNVQGSTKYLLKPMEVAKILEIGKSKFYQMKSEGRLPLPLRLGKKSPRWRRDEVQSWLAAGCPDTLTWQKQTRNKKWRIVGNVGGVGL